MPKDYLAPYILGKQQSEKKLWDRAQYGAAMAEMLGYYTPELEQAVMAPMGKYPTAAERLFGAKPQPFQITGQPPPVKKSPIEQYLESKTGLSIPTEQSQPGVRMKTSQQRQVEQQQKAELMQLYQFMIQQQQADRDYQLRQQQQVQAEAESNARIDEIYDRIENPTVTEAKLMSDYLKDHPNETYYSLKLGLARAVAAASTKPSAEMQLVNTVAAEMKVPKTEAVKIISLMKSNPEQAALRAAQNNMTTREWRDPNAQEIFNKKVESNYMALVNLKNKIAPPMKEGELPDGFPFSKDEVRQHMSEFGFQSWEQAVADMQSLDKDLGPLNVDNPTESKPKSKPKAKPK